jgi:hypothetical protein
MDSLSGTPFGLYVAAYFWTLALVKWGINYLHIGNRILILFVVAVGIVMENLFFLITLMLLGDDARLPVNTLHDMGLQVLWGIFTGPVLMLGIRFVHNRLNAWFDKQVLAWKEQRG